MIQVAKKYKARQKFSSFHRFNRMRDGVEGGKTNSKEKRRAKGRICIMQRETEKERDRLKKTQIQSVRERERDGSILFVRKRPILWRHRQADKQ